jgi:hypothetical protein
MYESSDDESSDDEIDNEEIYAYEMYMKRKDDDREADSEREIEEEKERNRTRRSNEEQKKPMEKYEYKGKIYERLQKSYGKGYQWSHKNRRWRNLLEGLDRWRARGSPKREDKIYSNVNGGKDNVNFEQLSDIIKQQAKYIKRMSKMNNKN